MSLQTFTDDMNKKIAVHGWTVIGVFGDPERGTPTFSYTVGLSSMGVSDLLMLAVPSNHAVDMLNALAKKMINKEVAGTHLEVLTDITNLPVRLKHTSSAGLSFTRFANEYAESKGHTPTVIQVEIPDQNGRSPGDPACDAKILHMQDLDALSLIKDMYMDSSETDERPVPY